MVSNFCQLQPQVQVGGKLGLEACQIRPGRLGTGDWGIGEMGMGVGVVKVTGGGINQGLGLVERWELVEKEAQEKRDEAGFDVLTF